jgi:FKBP-type peptidyl-prolyl cis-trans isomerase FklB
MIMKKVLVAAIALGLVACQPAENKKVSLENIDDKNSYAVGIKFGESMKNELAELKLNSFFEGMTHGFEGKNALLTTAEVDETVQAFQAQKMAEMKQKSEVALEENKIAGAAFLATNKTRENVKTLDSGLQYEVITSGEGDSPSAADKVTVHYHGTLIDGTVFDSSVERGSPATFGVGQVIKGWTEALQLMKAGDKWKLFIPADLAYGPRGAGAKIGPNSALIFEVELLSIEKNS